MRFKIMSNIQRGLVLLGLFCGLHSGVQAQSVNFANTPLLSIAGAPGLVMLTMSRDQRLFYAAYNDTTDIDNDGAIDSGFKPNITYYGYFDSGRCYEHTTSGTARFRPVSLADATTGCSTSTGRWHGNWLNWVATSRMDALRKVLYGGYRVTDTTTSTILEAASIPPDSHIWGKEYRPVAAGGTDAYNITLYTPLPMPTTTSGATSSATGTGSPGMHIFLIRNDANSTSPYLGGGVPQLRVVQNVNANIDRVWLWASSERPVGIVGGAGKYRRPAGSTSNPTSGLIGYGLPGFSGAAYSQRDFNDTYSLAVRVQTCVDLGGTVGREANCSGYPASAPTIWKPTGVLHQYAANDSLKFGLLTGSYHNNYSGGVVRKNVGTFSDEFNASTGIFTSVNGIVRSINRISYVGFDPGSDTYVSNARNGCSSLVFLWDRLRCEGEVNAWGAPVAEMMYEGIRYYMGKSPTAAFANGVSGATSLDTQLGIPLVSSWQNPFRTTSGGSPICSRPLQMVIADPITSFDSDQLPGSGFLPNTRYGATPSYDITGLDVGNQADAIWNLEFGSGASKNFFVGQTTSGNSDGNPSAKPASSFKFIRGHAPDETNTQGSYYAASVAKFAREQGVTITNGTTTQNAKIDTVSVALGSVIPRLEFSYAGKSVSLVPFAKTVGGCSNSASAAVAAPNGFQPTGLVTGFFFDRVANTVPGNADATINGGRPFMRFMVSFSDMDVGGDNEADANVYYTVSVNSSGQLNVRLDSYYTATCAVMHLGYVISGTTKDGVYLEVKSAGSSNIRYYLDTPGTRDPATSPWGNPGADLGEQKTRAFTLSSTSTASYIPKDPLWYAAKYGGAGVLDARGDPTNYFRVTSPANLPTQIGKAFRSAAALAAVASTSVVGVGQRSLGNAAIYQASFDSLTWTSRIFAFPVNATTGIPSNTPAWEASSLIDAPTARNLWLGRGGSAPQQLLPTTWGSLSADEQADFGDVDRYNYLLGDKSKEERKGGGYRNRGTTSGSDMGSVMGDVVDSDPQIVSQRDFGYGASDTDYNTFVSGINSELLVLGANDGFLRVFDASITSATAGKELFGFMPQAARTDIAQLADPDYSHRFIMNGPVALGHAKITVPDDGAVKWRSVVVATGGNGAQTVVALNVSSTTFNGSKVLWELDAATLPAGTQRNALGNVMGRPVIGKLSDGTWVAIFGNGVNSVSDTAKLFVVNLQTGAVISVLDTNNSVTGNGLLTVYAVRSTTGTQDSIQYVYGADIKGNIWRFDLSPASSTSWTTGAWVYATPSTRPITAELLVGELPAAAVTAGKTGKLVYFGTGSYLKTTDPQDTSVQALYGVQDSLTWTSSVTPQNSGDGNLVSMTMSFLGTYVDQRVTSGPTDPWWEQTGKVGWVLPLTTGANLGERVIAQPVRYTRPGVIDALLFTSIVPSADPCNAGVQTWVTAINPGTGLASQIFVGLSSNSLLFPGGSPRGVFVLSDAVKPTMYISMSSYGSTFPSSSFNTGAGGQQTTCIAGTCTDTRVGSIDLTGGGAPPVGGVTNRRQVWRQLK
jgi:type IV pilus assembly protein PilY1